MAPKTNILGRAGGSVWSPSRHFAEVLSSRLETSYGSPNPKPPNLKPEQTNIPVQFCSLAELYIKDSQHRFGQSSLQGHKNDVF